MPCSRCMSLCFNTALQQLFTAEGEHTHTDCIVYSNWCHNAYFSAAPIFPNHTTSNQSLPYSQKCLRGIKFAVCGFGGNSQTVHLLKFLCGRGLGVVVSGIMQLSAMLEYNFLYATWLLFSTGTQRSFQTTNPSDYTLKNCL